MKKLWIAALTVLFILTGFGIVYSQSPIQKSEYELVFNGPLDSEYVNMSSIRFINTEKGIDMNKIVAWTRLDYTPSGINDRITMYKKYHGDSDKYEYFSYSCNLVGYDLANKKYFTIRFIDYDKFGNVLSDNTRTLNNARWFSVPAPRNYTLDVLQKYVAKNYDTVLARSAKNKKSDE